MAKRTQPIELRLRGDRWKAYLLTEKKFGEKFEPKTIASTEVKLHTLHFRTDELHLSVVIHELFHAYFSYACIDSAELTSGQTEEVVADFLGDHGVELITQARKLQKKLVKERQRMDKLEA